MFEAAARHLNFRLAADELHITQGAVAQQVRHLEADLGVKLFHREARGLSLTEAGRTYMLHVRRALDLIANATENLRPGKIVVTISVTPSFAAKWLVPRLKAFTDKYPELDVRIMATEGLADFQRDHVDIAVRQGRPPFGPDLRADLLCPIDLCAVCSPDLIENHGAIQTLEDLSGRDLLHDSHDQWDGVLGGQALGLAVRSTRLSQTSLAIDAAAARQGIALAPAILVEGDIAAGRLCRVLSIESQAGDGYYLVAPSVPLEPNSLEKIRGWLLEEVGSREGS
jgi:LysR family glycine cleavage system transcriptional activator